MAKERVDVGRSYQCHRNDMLVAFTTVVKKRFGNDAVKGLRPWYWFRREPASETTVRTGKGDIQVYQGQMFIKKLAGDITISGEFNYISVVVPKDRQSDAQELLADAQKEIETNSIYQGTALAMSENTIEFIHLADVDVASLVYNAAVKRDLKAHVWTLFEKIDECRDAGIELQRKVLFSGTYGTGKTMAALWTAKKAIERGWLFLYIQPTMEPSHAISFTLDFARKYSPAVVFIENLDHEQQKDDRHALERLMAAIDGALTKTGEFIIIMTTNAHENISRGLKRPGRIHKVINFDQFEPDDAIRLIKKVIPSRLFSPDIDWNKVGEACTGYAPSFVREVGAAAALLAISEGDEQTLITEALLLETARDLMDQHKVCTEGIGLKPPPS